MSEIATLAEEVRAKVDEAKENEMNVLHEVRNPLPDYCVID